MGFKFNVCNILTCGRIQKEFCHPGTHTYTPTASFRKPKEIFWRHQNGKSFLPSGSSFANMQAWKDEQEELRRDTLSARLHASDEQVPCPGKASQNFTSILVVSGEGIQLLAQLWLLWSALDGLHLDSGKNTCARVKIIRMPFTELVSHYLC